MNTDPHGLEILIVSPSAKKKHNLCISVQIRVQQTVKAFDKLFELVCKFFFVYKLPGFTACRLSGIITSWTSSIPTFLSVSVSVCLPAPLNFEEQRSLPRLPNGIFLSHSIGVKPVRFFCLTGAYLTRAYPVKSLLHLFNRGGKKIFKIETGQNRLQLR